LYIYAAKSVLKSGHEECEINSLSGDAPNSEEIIARISDIRSAYPGNLMARYFSEAYFNSLDAPKRDRVWRIIRTGIENPDSQIGAYAQNGADYMDFEPLLEPMIRDHHNIPRERKIMQNHDWSASTSRCRLDDIDPVLGDVSMRVRVGRNLAAFPLPGAMTKAQRLEFEALMIEAFATLQGDPHFGGVYVSLTPGSSHGIDRDADRRRGEVHQKFRKMGDDPYLASAGISSDLPFGRGVYIANSGDFTISVGEEDHLRLVAMGRGGNLAALFSRLHDGLDRLADLLPPFAHSSRYGFVASCPSNLGAAMRASLHLPLPKLLAGGRNLKRAENSASELGLSLRGSGGEHSGVSRRGLVDISPSARLGVTETEILQLLYSGAAALWAQEKSS
jgi:hypothetical protein